MIRSKFLIALVTCIGFSSIISFSSESPITQHLPTEPRTWMDWGTDLWQTGSQKLSQAKSYAMSFIPYSIRNMVSKWSTKEQIAVASTTIGFLALAGYNKDTIMQMVSNAYDNAPDLGITKGAATLYTQLPTHAQSGLQFASNIATQNPKLSTAAAIGAGLSAATKVDELNLRERTRKTGISAYYNEPEKNLQQQHETRKAAQAKQAKQAEQEAYLQRIINDKIFGEEYAEKANEICNTDYTNAEKLGKINLCISLKKNTTNPSINAPKDSKFFIAQEPTEEDVKTSINRQYKALQKYKENLWVK